jgi:hypothetical protein
LHSIIKHRNWAVLSKCAYPSDLTALESQQIFQVRSEYLAQQELVKSGDAPRVGFGHRKV